MVKRFTEFYIPVLKVLSDVEHKEINTLIDETAVLAGLSDEDKKITTKSGNQFRYRSNISWAVTDLAQGGFIKRADRGVYVITLDGLELLENHPSSIDREYLGSISPKFKEFLGRQGTRHKNQSSEVSLDITSDKPATECISSTSFSIKKESSNERDSDKVTLDELYQTLSILKKAKLSTREIEDRINQIQREASLRQDVLHIASIIDSISNFQPNVNAISIECIPKDFIKIIIGNQCFKYDLKESPLSRIYSDNLLTESRSYSNTTLSPNSIKSIAEPPQTPKVWIKPHIDGTFAVCGDTDFFIDLLKSFGGRKSTDLKNENGWIFLSGKREGLEKELGNALIKKETIKKDSIQYPSKTQVAVGNVDTKLSRDERILSKYRSVLTSLRTFNFLGVSGPHKAILLIAIFDLIKSKQILDNKIYFTDQLEQQYNAYWNKIIGGNPSLGAAYPYAHLGVDTFVIQKRVRPLHDYNITWNRQKIQNYISYLILDSQLFNLLKLNTFNRDLTNLLVDYYCCPKPKAKALNPAGHGNQNIKDYREDFKNFLNKSLNRRGETFSASSIGVYVGALSSDYMQSIVKKFSPEGNIFIINDAKTLLSILLKVEEDIKHKKTTSGYRAAVKHYMRYIDSQTQ